LPRRARWKTLQSSTRSLLLLLFDGRAQRPRAKPGRRCRTSRHLEALPHFEALPHLEALPHFRTSSDLVADCHQREFRCSICPNISDIRASQRMETSWEWTTALAIPLLLLPLPQTTSFCAGHEVNQELIAQRISGISPRFVRHESREKYNGISAARDQMRRFRAGGKAHIFRETRGDAKHEAEKEQAEEEDQQEMGPLADNTLNQAYEKWDKAMPFFRSDDSDADPRRPILTDTFLSEDSIKLIAGFIGDDKIIAVYSGRGYAESQISYHIRRRVWCSDIMPRSALRWTGNLKKDMELEHHRISKNHNPEFIFVEMEESYVYVQQHHDCTNTTLLCFMPPPLKSDFGRTIKTFKQRGGRKIVVSGSFLGEVEDDACGDKEGWIELTENWDKTFETTCSALTPLTLTLWKLYE